MGKVGQVAFYGGGAMRNLFSVLALAVLVGCQDDPRPAPVAKAVTVSRAVPAAEQAAEATPVAAIIPPVAVAAEVLAQAPPPALPSSLTVIVAGHSWRGTSLNGTYTLTQTNPRDPIWRYDLLVPIGGVVRIEASYAPDGLGGRRLFVRLYEQGPQQPYTRFGWCNYSPPAPAGWSNTVCSGRVGYTGPADCPVTGTATVTAN